MAYFAYVHDRRMCYETWAIIESIHTKVYVFLKVSVFFMLYMSFSNTLSTRAINMKHRFYFATVNAVQAE